MLTAHLASGYVLGRCLPRRLRRDSAALMPLAVIGAVFPDLDMIWFYLVDDRAFHHHRYWVHVPAFWGLVAAVVLPVAARSGYLREAGVFLAAILMHLMLDTIGGGIIWGAPFTDHLYEVVTVPATQSHWVLSFVLHWTFALEVAVWGLAILVWWRGEDGAKPAG